MSLERFNRRELFKRALPASTGLLLAACAENIGIPTETFILPEETEMDHQQIEEEAQKSILYPFLSIENPVLAEKLETSQKEALHKLRIKQISFQPTADNGTNINVEFEKNTRMGPMLKTRNSYSLSNPGQVIIWSRAANGTITGSPQITEGKNMLMIDGTNISSASLRFSFLVQPQKDYVVSLQSGLVDLPDIKAGKIAIPFRFGISTSFPTQSSPNRT